MNREIKFRIWSKIQKLMNYPSKFVLDFYWFGVSTEHYIDDGSNNYPMSDFENLIVMQYTGLIDKKRREIYEGDSNGIYLVFFENGCFKLKTKKNNTIGLLSNYLDEFEVIGNIYENPELLK